MIPAPNDINVCIISYLTGVSLTWWLKYLARSPPMNTVTPASPENKMIFCSKSLSDFRICLLKTQQFLLSVPRLVLRDLLIIQL